MNLLKSKIITIVVAVFGILFITNIADAAILSVNPQQKDLALNETFLVEVRINSEQQVINAVEVILKYPSELLEVVKVSKGGSFLTLWLQEPAAEESAGIISLVGGIPNGSYVVDGKVATVTFRTKVPGALEVGFDENATSVRLNDGKGTAAPLELVSGIYQVGDTPFITINSPTHPDENSWYKDNIFIVEWQLKTDADYSYVLSDQPDEEPDNQRESTTGKVSFTDLNDGVFYFILKEKLPDEDWKIVGKRRVMIDSQPPLPIEAAISQDNTLYDGKYFLIFSASDKTSGVDRYDIIEGSRSYTDVHSPYILKDQTKQEGILIRAFDRAGNYTDKSFGELPRVSEISTISLPVVLLVVVLILLIILLIVIKRRSIK